MSQEVVTPSQALQEIELTWTPTLLRGKYQGVDRQGSPGDTCLCLEESKQTQLMPEASAAGLCLTSSRAGVSGLAAGMTPPPAAPQSIWPADQECLGTPSKTVPVLTHQSPLSRDSPALQRQSSSYRSGSGCGNPGLPTGEGAAGPRLRPGGARERPGTRLAAGEAGRRVASHGPGTPPPHHDRGQPTRRPLPTGRGAKDFPRLYPRTDRLQE